MKSNEVYRVLRAAIGPWAKAQGFGRAKSGMLAFVRPEPPGFLLFWCQCSQDGWDRYGGSKFTVEFQVSAVDEPGAGGANVKRRRLAALLSANDLERVRPIQNDVIRKLPPPDPEYVAAFPDDVRSWYLAKFAPEVARYTAATDLWLRYHGEQDVKRWADFLAEVLPSAVVRMTAM